ncbi:MAG: chemotaxis protein CheW [Peptostreptococcaceae bacterium]|nr:chemotaxis protein CheW [Peptostreptococcaceae bacterium]
MEEMIENVQEVQEIQTNMEKYLNFRSDGLLFGINTKYVTEIITNTKPTFVPMLPYYVKGIVNLRGQIIPIIDIRLRLGKPAIEYDDKACIVVVEWEGTSIGIVVDTVVNVIDIDTLQISPMRENSVQEMVNGVISLNEKEALMILDCELLINS